MSRKPRRSIVTKQLGPGILLLLALAVAGCADIAITKGSILPPSPREGDTLTVDLTVRNNNLRPILNAVVSVFFYVGRTAYALPDQQLPRVSLLPFSNSRVRVQWPLRTGWGNKQVRVLAVADITHAIDEVDERNNTLELGNLRIAPVADFVCQGNGLIMQRFQSRSYQCFDIRDMALSAIQSALASDTERVLLYGYYAVFDCPVARLTSCNDYIRYLDGHQHEFQTNYVGAETILNLDARAANPWNLVYIAVYPDFDTLALDCGAGASACIFGGSLFGRIAITEWHLDHRGGTVGIQEGSASSWYTQQWPETCHAVEYHEYQHMIDRLLLQPAESWFEEMVARLFADNVMFPRALCPGIEYSGVFYEDENGQVSELADVPSLYAINSELPFDNFGTLYAAGDTCRQAIIMQMNRAALAQGQPYLRKLFRTLRVESIATKHEVAKAIWIASDNAPEVRNFLQAGGCAIP